MERPNQNEADTYFFRYIDLVKKDAKAALASQLETLPLFCSGINEEKSLSRYAPDKWSIRELLNHITDTERVFSFRALWFARGFDSPLPTFDQNTAVAGAEADTIAWAEHVEEFRRVRLATISLFEHLPPGAENKIGVASGKQVSVRALEYLIAGHAEHHTKILRERYL